LIKSGQSGFLVETDESVQIPAEMAIVVSASKSGIPTGMQPVVELEEIERDLAQIREGDVGYRPTSGLI